MKITGTVAKLFPLIFIAACGGGGGSGSSSFTASSSASTGFPASVSVASPLASTSSTSQVASLDRWQKMPLTQKIQVAWGLVRHGEWNALAHLSSGNPFIADAYAAGSGTMSESAAFVALLDSILAGTVPLSTALDPSYLLESQAPNANCYGPSLNYADLPDGALPNSGQLPGGDLGIWQSNVGNDPSDTACAAAQLNTKMRAAKRSVHTALVLLAGMRYQAFTSATTPTAGASSNLLTQMNALAIADVTFTTATLALSSDGLTWNYVLGLTVTTTGPSAGTYPVNLTLSNTQTSDTDYSGTLQLTAENTVNAGNCPASPGPDRTVTQVSSVKYNHTSTSTTIGQRSGTFCGDSTNLPTTVYTVDNQVNPAATFVGGTGQGWADNFSRFAADFNPSTLDGNFVYGWQAGYGDGHTRTFNVWTQTTAGVRAGEAYFGFGDDISTSDGSIKGMICNWAGPGNSHSYADYAQRQALAYDDTSGKWLVGTSGSDIRYAPANSCQYTDAQHTGGATFWYDRDLTNSSTADPTQANLIVDPANGTYPFDLMDKGSSVDITAEITGRGFTLPANF
ncbi:MAG: hypothetical protein V4568_17155 [Pseudomonadota bacterium]